MKKSVILCFFLLFSGYFLSAQAANKVTEMINLQNVSFNQAAYFAASYLNLGSENMSDEKAGEILTEKINFAKLKKTDEPLTVKHFAYLCVKVWDIQGGLNWRIGKSPRYALRELKALEIIPAHMDPDRYVSGREVLHIMSKCAAYSEKRTKEETEQ